jgi:non-ribosomal peptide synthetase component F
LCIGVAFANRGRLELEPVIGVFVNVLPLRFALSPDLSFDTLLARVTQETRSAGEHQDYPFDRLVDNLAERRGGSRMPLINVVYSFQNFMDLRLGDASVNPDGPGMEILDATDFPVDLQVAKFDWTLVVTDLGPSGIELALEYNRSIFQSASAERCLAAITRFASMVVPPADPADDR